jgi:hypothetical protein
VGTGRLRSTAKLEMTHIFQAHGPAVGEWAVAIPVAARLWVGGALMLRRRRQARSQSRGGNR